MNGQTQEVNVNLQIVVGSYGTRAGKQVEATLRFYDERTLDIEIEDLKRTICMAIESAVRQEVIVQVR